MKLNNKVVSLSFAISIAFSAVSQSIDTVRIRKDMKDYVSNFNSLEENGSYFINGENVDKQAYESISKSVDSLSKIISLNLSNYFVFVTSSNRTVEEGVWWDEYFSGYYKGYNENGSIREEGYYTEPCYSIFYPGQKTGKWKYYNVNGKLVKEILETPKRVRLFGNEGTIYPCNSAQKMLYKKPEYTTVSQLKLKGSPHHSSSYFLFEDSGIDSTLALKFIKKFSSDFIDSVFNKKECLNNGVFALKIYTYDLKDTIIEFSISYIKLKKDLPFVKRNEYFEINGRQVLVKFSRDLNANSLKHLLKSLNEKERFDDYLTEGNKESLAYKGNYKLNGKDIEATFSSPYYILIPSDENILSD